LASSRGACPEEPRDEASRREVVACVDFGSTYTKASLVDVDIGQLIATASHPTTVGTDVLDGWDACRDELTLVDPRAGHAAVMACSSAGGGLRIGVERQDTFGKLLAVGLTTVIGLQVFTIAAGVLRLIPLTGVPLPLVSYGGTSRVATFVILALLVRSSAGAWYRVRKEP